MTYDEKVAKAKATMESIISKHIKNGYEIGFSSNICRDFECSVYKGNRTLFGRSNRSSTDKHSEYIGKCVALFHALGIGLPDWIRESPVEKPKEKKYKWVSNKEKYLNWCINNALVPTNKFLSVDWDCLFADRFTGKVRELICDKVEVE